MKVLDSNQSTCLHSVSTQPNQKQQGRIETLRAWSSRHPLYATAAAVAVVGSLVFLGISSMSSTPAPIPAPRVPKEGAFPCCWGLCADKDYCYD